MRSQPTTETERAWVGIGVDDLTKYRIVQFLCHRLSRPDEAVEVDSLAASLGFHSLEQTTDAVEGLAHSGVVEIYSSPGQPARCALTPDRSVRATIGSLLQQARAPSEAAELLESLALRSLARARARAEGRPRANGHVHA